MPGAVRRIWSWLRRDGLLHIESCALIAAACGLFLPWWLAGVISLAAGAGKEIWDIRHGVASWHDMICDLIGVAIGTILTWLYCFL